MLEPQFTQALRLTGDDKDLSAIINNGGKVINERFESSAKAFIVTKV